MTGELSWSGGAAKTRSSMALDADDLEAARRLEELAQSPLGTAAPRSQHKPYYEQPRNASMQAGGQAFDAIATTIRSIVDHLDVSDRRNAEALREIQNEIKAMRSTAPASGAPAGGVPETFGKFEHRLEELARKIEGADTGTAKPQVKALEKRIFDLANTLEDMTSPSAPADKAHLFGDPGLAALAGYRTDLKYQTEPDPVDEDAADDDITSILASTGEADDESDAALERGFLRRRGVDLKTKTVSILEDDIEDPEEAPRPPIFRAAVSSPQKAPEKADELSPRTAAAVQQNAAAPAGLTEEMFERQAARLGDHMAARFEHLAESLKAQIAAPQPSPELDALQASVRQLAVKLDELAARPVAVRDEEMAEQVDAIAQRLDATEARFAGLDDYDKTIGKLVARIESAEQSLLEMSRARYDNAQDVESRFADLEQRLEAAKQDVVDNVRTTAIEAAGDAVRDAAHTAARESAIAAQDAALDAAREAARAMLRREATAVPDVPEPQSNESELVGRLQSNLAGIDARMRSPEQHPPMAGFDEDELAADATSQDEQYSAHGQAEELARDETDDTFDLPDPLANLRLPPIEDDGDAAEDEQPLLLDADEPFDPDTPREPGAGRPQVGSPLDDARLDEAAESHSPRQHTPDTDQAAVELSPNLRNARTTQELLAAARRAAQAASVQQSVVGVRTKKKSLRDKFSLPRLPSVVGKKAPRKEKTAAVTEPAPAEVKAKPISAVAPKETLSKSSVIDDATAVLAGTSSPASPIRVGPRVTPNVVKPKTRKPILFATLALIAVAGGYQAYSLLGRPDLLGLILQLTGAAETPAEPAAAQPDQNGLLAPEPIQGNSAFSLAGVATQPAPQATFAGLIVRNADADVTASTAAGQAPASVVADDAGAAMQLPPLPEAIGPFGLRQAALANDPIAQFEIAARYGEGRGVAVDALTSAGWYQRAAALGLAPAQYRLASLYERGEGVPRDRGLAKVWYERAATSGNRRSMHNLAVIYADSSDGQADFVKAAAWFKKAADLGLGDSQYNLAILNMRGLGVAANPAEAYKWFAILANNGDADAAARRDQIASQLEPQALAAAKLAAQTWRAKDIVAEANTVKLPQDGWTSAKAESPQSPPGALPGADVIRLTQSMLAQLGYYAGIADGVWGPQSSTALQTFQRAQGLGDDGQLTPELVKILQQVLEGNRA